MFQLSGGNSNSLVPAEVSVPKHDATSNVLYSETGQFKIWVVQIQSIKECLGDDGENKDKTKFLNKKFSLRNHCLVLHTKHSD